MDRNQGMIPICNLRGLSRVLDKWDSPVHLTDAWDRGTVVKVWAWGSPCFLAENGQRVERCQWCFDSSLCGDRVIEHVYSDERSAKRALAALLLGVEVTVGNGRLEWINQASRSFEIIKVNRTRFRITYEMPNAGDVEAWRHIDLERNGVKYYFPRVQNLSG